jgi:thymidylate synthase
MRAYHDIVKSVLKEGLRKENRTGIDTVSQFGVFYKLKMADGFPLLTTKRVSWKNILIETLWFLSGDSHSRFLEKHNCGIWRPWYDENGALGPIYGHQWRRWQETWLVEPTWIDPPKVIFDSSKIHGVGVAGYKKQLPYGDLLYGTWYQMLRRCYNKDHAAFSTYGGAGVHVCKRWWNFANFAEDVQKFPRWSLKKTFPYRYTLDKDFYCTNVYSPETCVWASSEEQSLNSDNCDRLIEVQRPDGVIFQATSVRQICDMYGLTRPSVNDCLYERCDSHKGFKFKRLGVGNKKVRVRIYDQIAYAVSELVNNPNSRRISVNAWNPGELDQMALVPCHMGFTFNVQGSQLNLQMTQRSCDVALGLPYNIAGYALLLHLFARFADMEPGVFAHCIDDCHIYENHISGLEEQLTRSFYALPKLEIDTSVKTMEDVEMLIKDATTSELMQVFKLTGYESHPNIPFDVAV